MRKNLIVLQEGSKDCGASCLLSIIRYYGGEISLDRLIDMTKTTKDGTNFYNINLAANKFNLITKCYKIDDIEKIKEISTPFIVQMNNNNYNHFVVVYKIINNKIVIMDPACGKCVIDIFEFSNNWTGYIMLLEKNGVILNYKEDKVLNNIIKECLGKNVGIILFLIVLSIIFTLLSCFLGLYSQIVFDKIMDTSFNNLIVITIMFSVLFIVKNITNFVRNHLIIYLNQKIDVSIILSTYSKVILLPYAFYVNKRVSEVLSRINDLSYVKNFISKIIVTLFLDVFVFLVSCIMIYSVSKKILLYLIVIEILYGVIIMIFNKNVKKCTIVNQENSAKINNSIIESVNMFETIKGLNIESNMIFKFSKLYSTLLNNLFYSEKLNNIILIIKEIISDIGNLFVNFVIIKLIMDSELTVGNYMTITFLSGYLICPIKNVIDILGEYHYVKNALKRGNNLLEYTEEKLYVDDKLLVNGNITMKHLKYSFNNKNYVLKDINLFIREGEKVLVLGESGCGKSTIMKILYKYYEIDRNMVYINDYDLCDYCLSDIRKYITYVSQSESLFAGSIRDNIILDRNISEIDFLNICKILHIDDIVKNNILGYDYLIEEGGVNLSGGQRQRIILARSLLKDSNIIMIDEGLNQIDIKLEREILTNVFNYFYNKTFIVVSHRKNNIDLFDRIINVENGRVKEMEERCKGELYR